MNKKDIKTKRSKEKIITCAIELFGEMGYDNFSITTLCKKFNISKGLLYHNFSGKDELFLCCVKICYDKMLDFLKNGSSTLDIEQYMELRLQFFKEEPILSRIFFESFIQADSHVIEEINKLRSSLIEFNRLVYSNFLETVELRANISKQDAIEYFETIQKMINIYYTSPTFKEKSINDLQVEYKYHLSKFLDFIIWGVADKK